MEKTVIGKEICMSDESKTVWKKRAWVNKHVRLRCRVSCMRNNMYILEIDIDRIQ